MRLFTLEAGVEIFVRTGKCHTRVDTHVVINWDDASEVLYAMFDLIVGKELPFRLWIAPEKGCNKLAVDVL